MILSQGLRLEELILYCGIVNTTSTAYCLLDCRLARLSHAFFLPLLFESFGKR